MIFSGYNEGDYIQTTDGLFFAVKGSIHPPGLVVATLRYVPDPDGDREINNTRHRRVYSLGETTDYLRKYYPKYLNHVHRLVIEVQSVPHSSISRYYDPRKRLIDIVTTPTSRLESTLKEFVETISDTADVPLNNIGVSGSLLIGAQRDESDIDLNVYGGPEAGRVYPALRNMRENYDWVQPLTGAIYDSVLNSRWNDTGLPLNRFAEIEKRKILHGMVHGREYFIRLLTSDDNYASKPINKVTIKALITDDSRSFYNPCVYKVRAEENQTPFPILELKSYRGKFAEQVTHGEMVEARGTLEEVKGPDGVFYRLMLGEVGDYLLPFA